MKLFIYSILLLIAGLGAASTASAQQSSALKDFIRLKIPLNSSEVSPKQSIKQATKQAIEKSLYEHHQLTGERVYLALGNTASDLQEFETEIQSLGQSTSIYLYLDQAEKRIRIFSPPSMDAKIEIQELKKTLDNVVKNESSSDRVVPLVIYETLKQLQSPLVVQSSQYLDTLNEAGFIGELKVTPKTEIPSFVFWGLAFLLFAGVGVFFLRLLSIEVQLGHFGMSRLQPFSLKHLKFILGYRKSKKQGQGLISGSGVYGSW